MDAKYDFVRTKHYVENDNLTVPTCTVLSVLMDDEAVFKYPESVFELIRHIREMKTQKCVGVSAGSNICAFLQLNGGEV